MEQYNFDQNNLPQPNTLTFGILSLVFCGILGILGIIFGAIGRKKGKEFIAQGGELAGSSKVGFILSKVGLILGIIATIVIAIYLIVFIAAAANGAFR